MKKLLILICLSVCFYNCKSSKNTKAPTNVNSRPNKTTLPEDNSVKLNTTDFPDVSNTKSNKTETVLAFNIIDYAKQFSGVRYKYGGTTKSGMDCSGLVFESFKAYDILLPRSSRDMATKGVKIKIEDVKEGDLLFFHTNPKKRNTISHVGLVVTSRTGLVEFIHSTTQAGVIVSSLAERYWFTSFVEARRIL